MCLRKKIPILFPTISPTPQEKRSAKPIFWGDCIAKGPIFDIPGARIELVDGGLYRDSGGQLKEYSGGLKISGIKNGKISCADFLTLLKSLDSTKGRAFLWWSGGNSWMMINLFLN